MDFLSRLVDRSLGQAETVRPLIAPRFAPSGVAVEPAPVVEDISEVPAALYRPQASTITSQAPPMVETPSAAPVSMESVNETAAPITESQTTQSTDPVSSQPQQNVLPLRPVAPAPMTTETRIEAVTRIIERIETQRVEIRPQAPSERSSGESSEPLAVEILVDRVQPGAGADDTSAGQIQEKQVEPLVVVSQNLPKNFLNTTDKSASPQVVSPSVPTEPRLFSAAPLPESVQPLPVPVEPLQLPKPKAPTVNISIGQLEVRLTKPKASSQPVSRSAKVRQKPIGSLDNYLHKHNQRR